MPTPRIAIIGAGPGGLTLASILGRNGMQCTIFELDRDRSSRTHGGILDLDAETGQLALREAGLFEQFQKHSLPGAEAMKLIKSDGSVAWDENDMKKIPGYVPRDQPEIDRAALRDILLNSVEPSSINWDRKLLRVESVHDESKYNLHFTNGVEEGFDLVVGADGAWSKVRPLLTDQVPFYSGVTILELTAKEVSTKKQWLSKFTGSGSCFMFDEGRALVCQRNGGDRIRVYAGVRQPETWAKDCGIDWEQQDQARRILTERYFGDCHEDLRRVITTEASDGLKIWPLHMLPVGLKWSSRPGVTLLGDAAHLMTPFAGVGVNVALADALGLARALLKRQIAFHTDLPVNLADALQEYEEQMFERAKANMEKTWVGLQHHFSANGIDERVKKLRQRAKQMEKGATQREKGVHTGTQV